MTRSDTENSKKLRALKTDILGYEYLQEIIMSYPSKYHTLEVKIIGELEGACIGWTALIYDMTDCTDGTVQLVHEPRHLSVTRNNVDIAIDELIMMWELAKANHIVWRADEQQRKVKETVAATALNDRKVAILSKLNPDERKILGY